MRTVSEQKDEVCGGVPTGQKGTSAEIDALYKWSDCALGM